MFNTIADMLRGSAPDDLAHALGTDRTQTRRAMELGLPALITGLRDKTYEPGGAQQLSSLLGSSAAELPRNPGTYVAQGDPGQGAGLLDTVFGDRGEDALSALSDASGLSTRLLAQVMSVMAPLATGVLGRDFDADPDELRKNLSLAVEDLEAKGFGRVVELVSPGMIPTAAELPSRGESAVLDEPTQLHSLEPEPDRELERDAAANVVQGAFARSEEVLIDLDPAPLGPIEPMTFDDDPQEDMSPFVSPDPMVAAEPSETLSDVVGSSSLGTDTEDPPSFDTSEREPTFDSGRSLSNMGLVWWFLGSAAAILLLLLVLQRCGDADDAADDTSDTTVPTVDAQSEELRLAAQAAVVAYPNVSVSVGTSDVGTPVVIATGTVTDDREKALVDQALRQVTNDVRNELQVVPAPRNEFSINEIIGAQPQLSTFKTLLGQANLTAALDGPGPFTIFAPTNEVLAGLQTRLAEIQADPIVLQTFLQYHMLDGEVRKSDLSLMPAVVTLQGETVTVSSVDGILRLNEVAPVMVSDMEATNGVIHLIGGALLAPSTAQRPEDIGVELNLAPIVFAANSSDLGPEAQLELDRVVEYLLTRSFDVEIGGHTDTSGDAATNQRLSQQRAEAVRDYLVGRGIASDTLTAVGYGSSDPIAPNDTPEERAQNRRITFRPR